MNKFFVFCLLGLFLTSCDDGDVIVTSFNFDDESQLNVCQNENSAVIYKVNADPNESISFNFDNPEEDGFTGTFEGLAEKTTDSLVKNITDANKLIYRTYNGSVNGSQYFCSDVPPSSPTVKQEYISTTGGFVIFYTTITEQKDNDGVPREIEDINGNGVFTDDDSDGDGIPDFMDTDDDNDNIPTAIEINVAADFVDENNYPDTDGDGIPNYLDPDDDGDGIPTRLEDVNAYANVTDENGNEPILNPADDFAENSNTPNYLDPEVVLVATGIQEDDYNQNIITRNFSTRIIAKNATLKSTSSNEEITNETLIIGTYSQTANDILIQMDF